MLVSIAGLFRYSVPWFLASFCNVFVLLGRRHNARRNNVENCVLPQLCPWRYRCIFFLRSSLLLTPCISFELHVMDAGTSNTGHRAQSRKDSLAVRHTFCTGGVVEQVQCSPDVVGLALLGAECLERELFWRPLASLFANLVLFAWAERGQLNAAPQARSHGAYHIDKFIIIITSVKRIPPSHSNASRAGPRLRPKGRRGRWR